jgi:hypothetical protein
LGLLIDDARRHYCGADDMTHENEKGRNDLGNGVDNEIRPAHEVARRRQAELHLEEHWRARDARLHERSMPPGIDIEIVQERHHAINWITGYDGLRWDEVATDT